MASELIEAVQKRVTTLQKEDNGLVFPAGYNIGNALNYANLIISQDYALNNTDQGSKIQALLDMTLQGLSPEKKQGYFIKRGNNLTFMRSYFGSVSVLNRLPGVERVWAKEVHEGEQFEIDADEHGRLLVDYHPSFACQDAPIIGAFACVEETDGTRTYTVMTKREIDQSWSHTSTKNNKVQTEFPQEMAKRTVLNRATKMFINTLDMNQNIAGAVNRSTENEYDDEKPKGRRRDVTPAEDKNADFDKFLDDYQAEQNTPAPDPATDTDAGYDQPTLGEATADA